MELNKPLPLKEEPIPPKESINETKDINISPTEDIELEDISLEGLEEFELDLKDSLPSKTLGLMFKYTAYLRKNFSHRETMRIIRFINKEFMNDPIQSKHFFEMSGSLKEHIAIDIKPIADKTLEYLRMVESAPLRDIKDYCKESSEICTKALALLADEGWVIKHRREYKIIQKIEWQDKIGHLGELLPFNVPFFQDKHYFRWGDILLIGAGTGTGKTIICMNMIKELIKQGIKPYYITTEIGGRHGIISRDSLGLKDGDYFFAEILNAENIELKPNAITFIDWLLPKDYSEVDKLFQFFANKMSQARGFLIIFMQLRDFSHAWFAPDMCKMFPAFATRYLLNKDRKGGNFKIDKIREAKGASAYEDISCSYDFDSKVIAPIIIEGTQCQEAMDLFGGKRV